MLKTRFIQEFNKFPLREKKQYLPLKQLLEQIRRINEFNNNKNKKIFFSKILSLFTFLEWVDGIIFFSLFFISSVQDFMGNL